MKKIISLIIILIATASSRVFADNTNNVVAPCEAEISVRLKEPAIEIKTNKPVILTIQIKNTSTNEMLLFRIDNLPSDFSWVISSLSGKDLPLKHFVCMK